MSAVLSLHLALHLVPYLDSTDIARARRVCKAWYHIFSSSALAHAALRVHFPLCREIHSPSPPLDYSMFNRVSKRHAALKSGVPRQELRVPIIMSRRNIYVWTFSENLLVLQSSRHPRVVLTLIYLDARTECRKIINGNLVLDAVGGRVTKLKVCRNMLLVERTSSDRAAGRPEWHCSAHFFRVSISPGNSEVIATKVSSFDTFGFDYANISKRATSDHSGKYYAAYSSAGAPRSRCAVQIWDIETGEMVRRIPALEFPKIPRVTNVMVIAKQGPDGPQQVVVAGRPQYPRPPAGWTQFPGEWGDVTDFKVFPIEPGPSEWTGCIAKHEEQQGRSLPPTLEAPLLANVFKVPRYPAGITSLDTPDNPGYLSEEIGITLWDSKAGNLYSFYHKIIPSHPSSVSAPDVPIVVEREFRMDIGGRPCCSPFTIGSRSGLSLAMDPTGGREYFETRPLLEYQLFVRSFYPSATPGVMDLEWETCLKSSGDGRTARRLFSHNRNVDNFNAFPRMVVDEDELATAFLEWNSGVMDLVLVLWDDEFHGELPLGGKVLN